MSRAQNQHLRGLDKIPLATKFVLTIPFTIFLIDRFFDKLIRDHLADFPYQVIYENEFYRLFFAQFVEVNIYAFFGCPIILFFYLRDIEQRIGTVAFLIDFLYKGFLIQLVFVLLSYLFLPLEPIVYKDDNFVVNYGLTIMIVFYSTVNACVNPKQNATFLGVFCYTIWAICELPVLIFLFHYGLSLNSMQIITSLLAACIDVFLLSHVISRPIEACGNILEKCCVFSIFNRRVDFYFSRYGSLPESSFSLRNCFKKTRGTGVQIGSDENEATGAEQQL